MSFWRFVKEYYGDIVAHTGLIIFFTLCRFYYCISIQPISRPMLLSIFLGSMFIFPLNLQLKKALIAKEQNSKPFKPVLRNLLVSIYEWSPTVLMVAFLISFCFSDPLPRIFSYIAIWSITYLMLFAIYCPRKHCFYE